MQNPYFPWFFVFLAAMPSRGVRGVRLFSRWQATASQIVFVCFGEEKSGETWRLQNIAFSITDANVGLTRRNAH
jgi:hypothetical protein